MKLNVIILITLCVSYTYTQDFGDILERSLNLLHKKLSTPNNNQIKNIQPAAIRAGLKHAATTKNPSGGNTLDLAKIFSIFNPKYSSGSNLFGTLLGGNSGNLLETIIQFVAKLFMGSDSKSPLLSLITSTLLSSGGNSQTRSGFDLQNLVQFFTKFSDLNKGIGTKIGNQLKTKLGGISENVQAVPHHENHNNKISHPPPILIGMNEEKIKKVESIHKNKIPPPQFPVRMNREETRNVEAIHKHKVPPPQFPVRMNREETRNVDAIHKHKVPPPQFPVRMNKEETRNVEAIHKHKIPPPQLPVRMNGEETRNMRAIPQHLNHKHKISHSSPVPVIMSEEETRNANVPSHHFDTNTVPDPDYYDIFDPNNHKMPHPPTIANRINSDNLNIKFDAGVNKYKIPHPPLGESQDYLNYDSPKLSPLIHEKHDLVQPSNGALRANSNDKLPAEKNRMNIDENISLHTDKLKELYTKFLDLSLTIKKKN